MTLLTRRGLTPRAHGAVDSVACGAIFFLPGVLKLPHRTRRASQAAALGYLGISVLTDYPLGLRRRVPFQVHGRTELLSVPLLTAVPRLFGDASPRERTYWLALALTVTAAYVATDWNADPDA